MRHAVLAALFGVGVLMGASSASGRSQSELDRFEADVRCKGTRCEALVKNTGQRALDWVGFELPTGTAVNTLTGTNRASCTFEDSFGACRWLNAQGLASFPVGKTRTMTFRANPGIGLGTRFVMCGGGTLNDQFCAEDDVEVPESDLELEVQGRERVTKSQYGVATPLYRFSVTNNGPSTSPGAILQVFHSHKGPRDTFNSSGQKPITCPPYNRFILKQRCTMGELHPGEMAKMEMRLYVRSSNYRFRAVVTGSNPDPNLRNNRSTKRIQIKEYKK